MMYFFLLISLSYRVSFYLCLYSDISVTTQFFHKIEISCSCLNPISLTISVCRVLSSSLPIYLYLSIHLFIYLSVGLSIYRSLRIFLSFCLKMWNVYETNNHKKGILILFLNTNEYFFTFFKVNQSSVDFLNIYNWFLYIFEYYTYIFVIITFAE